MTFPLQVLALAVEVWVVQVMIWNSGEAELETIRLTDDRCVNKHYDLTNHDDLHVLLDELVRILLQDRVPDAAVVFHAPGPPRDEETRHRRLLHEQ